MASIALIPARGGSKRIPKKNVKLFNGKPMITWAIETALESELFSDVFVSTDDEEVRAIALDAGADASLTRDSYLAGDVAPTLPVVQNAIEQILAKRLNPDRVACIYPCTPLLTAEVLKRGVELAIKNPAYFVFPVVRFGHPIQRAFTMNAEGKLKFLTPEHEFTRTQDLPDTYHDAGQFYVSASSTWLSSDVMHSKGLGFELDTMDAVDIDTPADWKRAELLATVLR